MLLLYGNRFSISYMSEPNKETNCKQLTPREIKNAEISMSHISCDTSHFHDAHGSLDLYYPDRKEETSKLYLNYS